MAGLSPQSVATEADIQKVIDVRSQLRRPFRLGIYLTAAARGWGVTWRPEDKRRFLELGQKLQQAGIVSEAVFMSAAVVSDEKLELLRLAGARHGVDAILVVSGAADVDRYNNLLGPTYALLLTAFFVPGTVLDGLFVAHAGLWDVRNGFLYASVEADGQARMTRPALMANEHELISQAKERSLEALIPEIDRQLHSLAAAVANRVLQK